MKNIPLLFVFLIMSCQTVEEKKEKFNLENHLKSNKWCGFNDNKIQSCFSFNEGKMIIKENGLDKAIVNVTYKQISDSVVVVKVLRERVIENYFRMKSIDTLYFSQGDENDFKVEFIRTK